MGKKGRKRLRNPSSSFRKNFNLSTDSTNSKSLATNSLPDNTYVETTPQQDCSSPISLAQNIDASFTKKSENGGKKSSDEWKPTDHQCGKKNFTLKHNSLTSKKNIRRKRKSEVESLYDHLNFIYFENKNILNLSIKHAIPVKTSKENTNRVSLVSHNNEISNTPDELSCTPVTTCFSPQCSVSCVDTKKGKNDAAIFTTDTDKHMTNALLNAADSNSQHSHFNENLNKTSLEYSKKGKHAAISTTDTDKHMTNALLNVADSNSRHSHFDENINKTSFEYSKIGKHEAIVFATDTDKHMTNALLNAADSNSRHSHFDENPNKTSLDYHEEVAYTTDTNRLMSNMLLVDAADSCSQHSQFDENGNKTPPESCSHDNARLTELKMTTSTPLTEINDYDSSDEVNCSSSTCTTDRETIPYVDEDLNEKIVDGIVYISFDAKKIKSLESKKVTSVGSLVVVRLQIFGWWFGKVIKTMNRNHVSVRWFGDNTVMEVPTDCIEDFRTFTEVVSITKMKRKSYKKAVNEFLHEIFYGFGGDMDDLIKLSERSSCSIFQLLLDWGRNGFQGFNDLPSKQTNGPPPYRNKKINTYQDLKVNSSNSFSSKKIHSNPITDILEIPFPSQEKRKGKYLMQGGINLDYSLIGASISQRQCTLVTSSSSNDKVKQSYQKSSVGERPSAVLNKTNKDTIDDDIQKIKEALKIVEGKGSPVADNNVKLKRGRKPRAQSPVISRDTSVKLSCTEEGVVQQQQNSVFKYGDLVIGKLKGFDWWFGKVTSHQKAKQKEAVEGSCWVKWYGDHKHSQLPYDSLENLSMFPHRVLLRKLKGSYLKAVIEILEEAACRCNKDFVTPKSEQEKWLNEMLKWGMSKFQPEGLDKLMAQTQEEDEGDTLDEAAKVNNDADKEKNYPDLCDEVKSLFHEVFQGTRNIEKLCLSCGDTKVVTKHPLFEGGLCKECKETFMEGVYLYDDEDFQMYCCICNDGQQIISCDKVGCRRSYCSICLDLFCGNGYMAAISHEDCWECFLCTGKVVRILKRRMNWQDCLNELFKNDMDSINYGPAIFYDPIPFNERKPLRVLALFDGISTGYHVLKELDFLIDVYVAAEIDEKAVAVSQVRSGCNIHHIGDVRKICKKDVDRLGPFDLVMGGSPCNDLSIANPARKGIYDGTGVLFFEYYRILNFAKPNSTDARPFFWFFENVVGMRYHDREVISRYLERHPVVVSAKDVSAQYRTRYFWGNLPGMNRSLAPLPNDKLCLQECLEPDSGRKAKFDKVRCITTMSHSLKQTKHLVLPVTMNHKEDGLWITEIERIFGFPDHYTDVANMGRTHRQKLLGKAWSVPVIRHLLAPLRDYFRIKSHVTKDGVLSDNVNNVSVPP